MWRGAYQVRTYLHTQTCTRTLAHTRIPHTRIRQADMHLIPKTHLPSRLILSLKLHLLPPPDQVFVLGSDAFQQIVLSWTWWGREGVCETSLFIPRHF